MILVQCFMYYWLDKTNVLHLIHTNLYKDITCICTIVVNTDPDCYQLVSMGVKSYSTTTTIYDITSTTTDESFSR